MLEKKKSFLIEDILKAPRVIRPSPLRHSAHFNQQYANCYPATGSEYLYPAMPSAAAAAAHSGMCLDLSCCLSKTERPSAPHLHGFNALSLVDMNPCCSANNLTSSPVQCSSNPTQPTNTNVAHLSSALLTDGCVDNYANMGHLVNLNALNSDSLMAHYLSNSNSLASYSNLANFNPATAGINYVRAFNPNNHLSGGRFARWARRALERRFARAPYLAPATRRTLAQALSLTDRQVKTWFQNRRAKWRRALQQTARDDVTSSTTDHSGRSYSTQQQQRLSMEQNGECINYAGNIKDNETVVKKSSKLKLHYEQRRRNFSHRDNSTREDTNHLID